MVNRWLPIETAPCEDVLALVYWNDGMITLEDLDHDSDPEWWSMRGAVLYQLVEYPDHA